MTYYSQFQRPQQAQLDDLDEMNLVVNLAAAAVTVAHHFEITRSTNEKNFEALRNNMTNAMTGIKVAANKTLLQLNHREAADAATEFFSNIEPMDLVSGHLTADDVAEAMDDTVVTASRMVAEGSERRA